MPLYLFEHVTTGETHEIVFHMNDNKVYNGPDGKAKGQWRRAWTKPQAAIDTQCDPFSSKDFVKVTNRKGLVGDLWDRSKEMSLKRAQKEGGVDPVKAKYLDDYAKRRHGVKHPVQRREETAKALAQGGISVEFGDD